MKNSKDIVLPDLKASRVPLFPKPEFGETTRILPMYITATISSAVHVIC